MIGHQNRQTDKQRLQFNIQYRQLAWEPSVAQVTSAVYPHLILVTVDPLNLESQNQDENIPIVHPLKLETNQSWGS